MEHLIHVEISGKSIESDGSTTFMSIARNITGRKQAEEEIHKLFVGRELQMAELKKQIAELEKKYSNYNSRT